MLLAMMGFMRRNNVGEGPRLQLRLLSIYLAENDTAALQSHVRIFDCVVETRFLLPPPSLRGCLKMPNPFSIYHSRAVILPLPIVTVA